MRVIGLDIGGANLKGVTLIKDDSNYSIENSLLIYYPIWKIGKEGFCHFLKVKIEQLAPQNSFEKIGITMTAELSDIFNSRNKGVEFILKCISNSLDKEKIFVLDISGNVKDINEALKSPINVASANWASTAKLISMKHEECILLDVGSTTTDIIPIVDHKIVVPHRTDLGRLIQGSLIYSGALRSPISSIAHEVPFKGKKVSISAEPFAFSGDVHIILKNISEFEYFTETADKRGKSIENCLARIARIICADKDMVGYDELFKIAKYIYNKQIEKIKKGIKMVVENTDFYTKSQQDILIVLGGLGGEFLGREAALRLGFKRFLKLTHFLGIQDSQLANAYSTAFLAASK